MCCSCRNAQERVVVENNTLNSAMCAQEPWACRNPLLEGGGFGPGGGTAAATGAGVAIGEALTNDKEQPNTGANWTDEEKAELGGGGSGTPGAGSRRMRRMLGITGLLLPHQKIALMRPLQHLTEMD